MGGGYDPRYQVKQFLARVRGAFSWLDIFTTGDSRWVLVRPVEGDTNGMGGWNTGVEFPFERKRFRRGVLPPRR